MNKLYWYFVFEQGKYDLGDSDSIEALIESASSVAVKHLTESAHIAHFNTSVNVTTFNR